MCVLGSIQLSPDGEVNSGGILRDAKRRGIQLFRERLSTKSARDNSERYCGWVLVHGFSKKFEIIAREAMDLCLRMLKESNKSRFDSYSVMKVY